MEGGLRLSDFSGLLLHAFMLSCFSHILTLCYPRDCSLPGSSVHGILQARILEWVAKPSSRRYSRPRDQTLVFCSPALQVDSLPLSHQGSPGFAIRVSLITRSPAELTARCQKQYQEKSQYRNASFFNKTQQKTFVLLMLIIFLAS